MLASDEAYTELWFEEPPVSALQLGDLTNVAVFNTLSKRSSMTGYRSGFVAGDPELIAALRHFRPTIGTAPQEFVQRASVVAWGDEEHVERARAAYARKRELVLGVLEREGIRIACGEATMYLWVACPAGETSEGFAARLLDLGVLVAPGSFLGPSGEGYVRFALVPTEEECARAVEISKAAFGTRGLAADLFTDLQILTVPVSHERRAEDLIGLLRTTSAYLGLDLDKRPVLELRIAGIVDSADGVYRMTEFVTLVTARRRS